MSRLVFSAASAPELELPALLTATRGAGFDAVELFRDRTASSVVHPAWSVRRIRQTLAAAQVRLAAYEVRPLTGRKADSDERNLAYNLRQLEWDIHLGRALGVRAIGLRGGARTDEARADLVDGVNQLLERLPDVTLLVGPRAGSPLEGPADYAQLMPRLGARARVLLDAGQLLGAHADPVAVAHAWRARIGLVRVSVPACDVHLSPLLAALGSYDGPIAVETPGAITAAAAREHLLAALS